MIVLTFIKIGGEDYVVIVHAFHVQFGGDDYIDVFVNANFLCKIV